MKSMETIETFEKKYLNILESIFLFVLLWVLQGFISDQYKQSLHDIVIDSVKNYRKVLSFKFQNPFGDNFFDLLDNTTNLTVFDLIYDLTSEKWTLLRNINFQIGHQINNKFEASSLNYHEILRLNPEALKLETIQKQIKNEQDLLVVLNNYTIFIETPKKILTKYFLEFLIEYEKNFIFVGNNHSGKSALLQDLYKVKLERNQMNAIMFSAEFQTIPQVK